MSAAARQDRPRRRWIGWAGAAALTLFAGLLIAVAARTAEAAECPNATDTVTSAVAAAARCGRRVEATGLRSERAQTFANVDGTLRIEQYATVQRVRRGNVWTAPDASLVRGASGNFSPAAAAIDVVVSGGGSGPLVSIGEGHRRLSLTWPSALPAPSISGDTATYGEVLPGVDLLVRAEVDSVGELLVVKNAVGAANAALASVRFGLAVSGLAVRPGDGSSVVWVDGAGATVFGAGTSLMWDSSTLSAVDVAAVNGGVKTAAVRAAAPGGRVATIPVVATATSLTLTPDLSLLTGTGVTYPVYIDPKVAPTSGTHWSMINQIHPTQSYWSYDRNEGAKVGYEDYDDELYRSMFWFATTGFAHATVTAATFTATLIHTASCNATEVDLYQTGPVGASTNWNNHQATWKPNLANVSAADCNDASITKDFTSAGLVGTVQAAATNDTNVTLGLRALSEVHSGHEGWKKFEPTTVKLSVTYDYAPAGPATLTSGGASCVTGSNRPHVASSTLKAYVDDVDANDKLSVVFQWKKLNADGSYPASLTGSQTLTSVTPKTSPTVSPALVSGSSFAWQVRSTDVAGLSSAWAGWCEFTVDTSAPPLPTVTPPSDFYNSDVVPTGDIGVPGTFTFGPNGASDVVTYDYYVQSATLSTTPVTLNAATDGTATVTFTPHEGGRNTLNVLSRDAAGNVSGSFVYAFAVVTSGPVGWWHANEGSGTTVDDLAVSGPRVLTLSGTGSARWNAPGTGRQLGNTNEAGLVFNGTDDQAQTAPTASTVVDVTKSFSLAAWALPTGITGDRTVVSQDGATSSGFRLQITGGQWCFTQDAGHKACASAAADAPVAGQWMHLVGVYDAPVGKLRFFLDGVLKSEVMAAPAIAATGVFAVGRGEAGGAPAEWFAGQVYEIRAWQRVVYDSQVAAAANDTEFGKPLLLGDWRLDGDASDWSDYGGGLPNHTGVPNSAATFVPAGTGAPSGSAYALNIDGTNAGAVSYPGPAVLRTDQSYTLSAWVKLGALPTANMSFVSMDSSCTTGFNLGIHYSGGQGRWALSLRSSDCGGNPTFPMASTASNVFIRSTDVNTWVRVVGVYDRGQGQLRLYVNGGLVGSVAHTTPWAASGGLSFGNCLSWGVRGDQATGLLDQVRVYVGALTDAQISHLQ